MQYKTYKRTVTMFLFSLLLSCTSGTLKHTTEIPLCLEGESQPVPKTVIVLPFTNNTHANDLHVLVRKNFYNHFSSKSFHDFELGEVDETLHILQDSYAKDWRQIKPSQLGKLFHADYLIYGTVIAFKKIFLGIYSQITIGIDIKMVDTVSGKVIWTKTVKKSSHDGGIPFSPFGIIPSALRSGFHMKKNRTADLIERACRDLVKAIPDPPCASPAFHLVEIQIASFLKKEHATSITQELQRKGYRTRIEKVVCSDNAWHRVLIGPYFEMADAEKVRRLIATDMRFKPIFVHHYPAITGKHMHNKFNNTKKE